MFTVASIALSFFVVLPALGQVINEDLKLTATDGAAGDYFGYSIAIHNGIVAVGTPNDNSYASGSASLFDALTGTRLFKLIPTDGVDSVLFGWTVAIDNDIVAVGAYLDNDNGSSSGSAYLFDAITGMQLIKLLPSDGAAQDQFGVSISICNGVVAVGAFRDDDNGDRSGSAYLFDASTGKQLYKLVPNDGSERDYFGSSIAIADDIVAVGAIGGNDNNGSAYLFDVSTGTQISKLIASDAAEGDGFGWSIHIDNGIVAVGAIGDDDNGFTSGSAYLFNASTGEQIAKLIANDGATDGQFGFSITIENGIVAVGTPYGRDNGRESGSAYLFSASTGMQIGKLLPSDGGMYDNFGSSIAIDNGVLAVGAPFAYNNGSADGSAYVFTAPLLCIADLTGEGVLDFFDISAFLSAFASQNPIADFTGEGIFDFFDVSAFLSAFAAGCP